MVSSDRIFACFDVAVTGNASRGTPDLPPHAGAAAPLDRWEVLNQVFLI
jgi:hypothetical protein